MEKQLSCYGIEKKPFVDITLDRLRQMGVKMAVATATDQARAVRYLREIGIDHKFDRIVCASMVENGKPKVDIYLYACSAIREKSPVTVLLLKIRQMGRLLLRWLQG